MIAVVAVNYHCETHVAGLHASLSAQDTDDWRLVVVDNGSDDEGAALLAELGPASLLLRPDGNLGYLGAVQFALEAEPEMVGRADWLVVSNPDIRLPDAGFLRALAGWDGAPARVLAPAIIDPDGRDQNPLMATVPSRALTAARTVAAMTPELTVLAEAAGRVARLAGRGVGPTPGGRPQRIFAPHGALMCFSAGYLRAGLTFHHELFLYGEEVAVAVRCAAAQVPVVWVPELEAHHSRHATTGSGASRSVAAHRRRGALWSRRMLAATRRSGWNP